jgi:hypothetical protein
MYENRRERHKQSSEVRLGSRRKIEKRYASIVAFRRIYRLEFASSALRGIVELAS